jgi:acetyl-CoA synthetase
LGHLPGVEFPHHFFPQPGDVFWTPADWAWIGGLIDVLFPAWHHGIPVVAYRAKKFDPEFAFHLMAKHHIRNTFLPPTALKLLRQVPDIIRRRYPFDLRTIASAGESLGAELFHWGKETLNVAINEFYGQTEFNLMVCNCDQIMAVRPGWMGRAVPGFEVEIIDDDGNPLPPGTQGNIVARRPHPVMFLKYWRNPAATKDKFIGDWCLTGDIGVRDEDGYFRFVGREDDLITSAGYRIGPGEIEDCLIRHPAVALAAVVGKPDPVRTQIVKAFIVLNNGVAGDKTLENDIRDYIRRRLAAHEYPRKIEFVPDLPMTATGKIIRNALRDR